MDGTAVIATSPDGNVQGCEVDFDQSKPAGFDLSEAQAERARIALSGRIIRGHCSPHLAKALTSDAYMARKVMDKLRDAGWRFEVRPISTHDTEERTT